MKAQNVSQAIATTAATLTMVSIKKRAPTAMGARFAKAAPASGRRRKPQLRRHADARAGDEAILVVVAHEARRAGAGGIE